MNRRVGRWCALLLACTSAGEGWGFDAPRDAQGGVTAAFIGFDEDWSGKKQKLAEVDARETTQTVVELRNDGERPVSGTFRLTMPDDWTVEGPATEKVVLPPGGTRRLTRTLRGTDRTLPAIYPVHAFFETPGATVHPIALVRAVNATPAAATPERVAPGRTGDAPAAGAEGVRRTFALDVRGERFTAELALGPQGVFDGTLVFSDGARRLEQRGFTCQVDGFAVGSGADAVRVAEVKTVQAADRLEVLHRLEGEAKGPVLRAVFSVRQGALCVAWDMPGTVRTPAGTPRYTKLLPGGASEKAVRAYAAHGNVLADPGTFRIRSNGFALSTRHVGADYANGLSLVQATDVVPDFWVGDAGRNLWGLEAHHDATFLFVPSARGAFAAARAFADASGYRRSPGFDLLNGRICLDQWGGDYAAAAADLRAAHKYGVGPAVFVKHDWQRWGYDFRLPDVYPPKGDQAGFQEMRRAAEQCGILFVVHDNFTDFYPDAEGFTFDAIRFRDDGTPITAWYHPGRRAQSYGWLPHAIQPWVKRNGGLLKAGFHPDGIFIDVLTAEAPLDYRDRAGRFYPKSVNQAAWCEAFANYRAALGRPDGVMISETGTDALVGAVDAAEADHPGADRWRMGDAAFTDWERVPWHDMATHGRMIMQAGGLGWRYAADAKGERRELTETHGYASDDYLGMTLLGGRQPMCGGPFNRGAVKTAWMIGDVARVLADETLEAVEFGDSIHQVRSTFSNGATVWQNRAADADWTVAGKTLPPWGFYAKTAAGQCGAIRRGGCVCGFAFAKDRVFVDARPRHGDGRLKAATVAVTGAESKAPRELALTVNWRVFRPIARGSTFLHVVDENGGEGPIHFQPLGGVEPSRLGAAGAFDTVVRVRVPDHLAGGVYDLRVGVCGAGGTRLDLQGEDDGHMRLKLGSLVVGPDGVAWRAPAAVAADAEKDAAVDFGKVVTDGAFRLERRGADTWRLTPLPGSRAFSATFAPALFGLKRVQSVSAAAVEPLPGAAAPTARTADGRVAFACTAEAFAYDLRVR